MAWVLAALRGQRDGHVFEAALDEAIVRGLGLIVVNVGHTGAAVDVDATSDEEVEMWRRRAEESSVVLDVRCVVHSDVVECLEDVVDGEEISRLVIGMRKRSPVGKLFMGSTAQRLILTMPVPVLAIKQG